LCGPRARPPAMTSAAAPPVPILRIQPSRGWTGLGLADLWRYRELMLFLTWRDIKVRYQQTVLVVAWAALQPLLAMLIFTIFFGRLAKMPSDGIPYALFAYCGLLPWQLFAYALTQSSNSLIDSQQLVKKVYFPRMIIPIAAVLSGLLDFVVSLVLLAAMMLYYGVRPGVALAAFPAFALLG